MDITTDTMVERIKNYLEENSYVYDGGINDEEIRIIYDLIFNNIVNDVGNNIKLLSYYGVYYSINNNYELMKKYYLIAIDNGDIDAMYNLGRHYEDIENDYDLMKEYFLMAIDNGYTRAMYSLGYYYDEIEINIDLMKKYYTMAIKKGDVDAMYNLGLYYGNIGKYDKMKIYFLMAFDNGHIKAMRKLAEYYFKCFDHFPIIECYSMAIKKGDVKSMVRLADYYKSINHNKLMKKYYLMAIEKEDIIGDSLGQAKAKTKAKAKATTNLGNYYENKTKIYIAHKYYNQAIDHYISIIENSKKKYDTKINNIFIRIICLCQIINNYDIIIHLIIKYDMYHISNNTPVLKQAFYNYIFTDDDIKILSSKSKKDIENAPQFIHLLYKSLNTHIDLMQLHFHYSINGIGFDKAKEHFIGCINNDNID